MLLFSLGGNFVKMLASFHDTTPISFIKAYIIYWVLFLRGGNFREEDKSVKDAKITPT